MLPTHSKLNLLVLTTTSWFRYCLCCQMKQTPVRSWSNIWITKSWLNRARSSLVPWPCKTLLPSGSLMKLQPTRIWRSKSAPLPLSSKRCILAMPSTPQLIIFSLGIMNQALPCQLQPTEIRWPQLFQACWATKVRKVISRLLIINLHSKWVFSANTFKPSLKTVRQQLRPAGETSPRVVSSIQRWPLITSIILYSTTLRIIYRSPLSTAVSTQLATCLTRQFAYTKTLLTRFAPLLTRKFTLFLRSTATTGTSTVLFQQVLSVSVPAHLSGQLSITRARRFSTSNLQTSQTGHSRTAAILNTATVTKSISVTTARTRTTMQPHPLSSPHTNQAATCSNSLSLGSAKLTVPTQANTTRICSMITAPLRMETKNTNFGPTLPQLQWTLEVLASRETNIYSSQTCLR